jgi:DNA-binding transcriptional LysR family regulator
MDKLACIRAFVTVVEGGGFSEAARRMGVSKALISKQVAQLEENLDLRLLHRTTRKVTPTSSGQAYFDQCRPLLAEFDELDSVMRMSSTNPAGELHVAAPVTFAEMHLMTVVSRYSSRYPDVTVKLDLTDRFVDLVVERIDVAIRIGELNDSSLVARKLGEVSMQLCASSEYLAEHGEPVEPGQLADHRCVLDSNYPGGNSWRLGGGDNPVSIEVKPHLIVNSARAGRELVRAGHGIAFLPSFAIADDINNGRVQRLLPEYTSEPIGIYAVYQHRKHLSAKIRLFIEEMNQYFKLDVHHAF